MTFGVYTKGASWEQRVECVEAVKVPTKAGVKSQPQDTQVKAA